MCASRSKHRANSSYDEGLLSDHESDHRHSNKPAHKNRHYNSSQHSSHHIYNLNDGKDHYANKDNPFGDNNLLSTFVWKKKREDFENREGKSVTRKEHKKREEAFQLKNREELMKVKKRRKERDNEMQIREEERNLAQREKEAEHFKVWEKQEDAFHLKQAQLRSEIRLSNQRAKPIDMLAHYISTAVSESASDISTQEPFTYLYGLSQIDLEDLLEDISVYTELEKGRNLDFWKDITIIAEEEMKALDNFNADLDETNSKTSRDAISSKVLPDVATIFSGKNHLQLSNLYVQVENKIDDNSTVDVAYWEKVLQNLKAYLAKLRLKERHQAMLQRKLEKLQLETAALSASATLPDAKDHSATLIKQEHSEIKLEAPSTHSTDDIATSSSASHSAVGVATCSSSNAENEDIDKDALLQAAMDVYVTGRYSPTLLDFNDVTDNDAILDPMQIQAELVLAQSRVKRGERADNDFNSSEADLERVRIAQENGFVEQEQDFIDETSLEHKYAWQDKYRPRKPRYFNKVHTGFEWNKYNQTHYDHDNPPPKIVQGYKFTIFYPDLIDKKNTPQYFIEPCSDAKDFVVLRFKAGAPYEDIAFKIVNKEWESSHKHGFKCHFQNKNFYLWFHFKRSRYHK